MDRKKQLIDIVGKENSNLFTTLIDQIIYLENKISEVEKLPFYKVNPKNPLQQKMLPAFKLYKELLQQYTNCIRTIARASGVNEHDEESPLRIWVQNRMGKEDDK